MKHKKLLGFLIIATLAFTGTLAACSKVEHTVSFDSRGGSAVASQTIADGGTAQKPADPTRENYEFDGWFTDEACTELYDFATPVASDVTLYAAWTEATAPPDNPGEDPGGDPEIPEKKDFLARFYTNGGVSVLPNLTVAEGDAVKAPAEVERIGYKFDGWYLEPGFSTKVSFPFTPERDTVFYAKWIPTDDAVTINFFYSYDKALGSSFPLENVEPITAKAGDKLDQPENPPDFQLGGKTMTFAFWCFESSWNYAGSRGTQPILFPYTVPQNMKAVSLYAAFVEKRANETIATLTVHRGDGEKDTVMYGYAGEKRGSETENFSNYQPIFSKQLRGEPLRAGYKATGYYKSETFTPENVYKAPFLLKAGENHVYLRWEEQAKPVARFGVNGGTRVDPVAFDYNGAIAEPAAPYKKGFIFDGWYREGDFDNAEDRWDFASDTAVKDINLYAKWVEKPIEIAYETDGGNAIETLTLDETYAIDKLPKTKKGGDGTTYNFYGWYRDSALTAPVELPYLPGGNATLYAKWSDAIDLSLFYFSSTNDGYMVGLTPAAKAKTETIEIPDSYFGDPVTQISASGFYKALKLKTVFLPKSIYSISKNGFRECPLLESVTGMKNVWFIGDFAFYKCPKLASVDRPDNLYNIGQQVFRDSPLLYESFERVDDVYYWGSACLGNAYNATYASADQATLKKEGLLTVKDGTRVLAYNAFANMSKITEAKLPDTLKYISYYPFLNCSELVKINVPMDLTKNYGSNPFFGCKKLKELTVPEDFNKTNRYYDVIDGCLITKGAAPVMEYGLPTIQAAPDGVAVLGSYALANFASETILLPDSMTSIGTSVFANSALKYIVIPDNVGTLADTAFTDTTELTSISFGKSVPKLTENLFKNSKSAKISTIDVSAENESMSARENVLFDKNATEIIYCAPTKAGVYKLPETVVSVPENAFSNTGIEVFVLPESATAIGDGWFKNNKSLKEIVLPYSLTSIGAEAFDGCANLTCVTRAYHSSRLGDIGARAFRNTALTEIYIPDGVAAIGDEAFFKTHLTDVSIPDSVVSVGKDAFPSSVLFLSIGARVETFGKNGDCAGLFNMDRLDSLTVSEENRHFTAVDNVLYNKAKTELLGFAPTIAELVMPDTVVTDVIGNFGHSLTNLSRIVFGASSFRNDEPDQVAADLSNFRDILSQQDSKLTDVVVSQAHPTLASRDGIVYTKDFSRILGVAPILTGNIVLPAALTEIPAEVFSTPNDYYGSTPAALRLSVESGSRLTNVAANAFAVQNYYASRYNVRAVNLENAKLLSEIGSMAFSSSKVERVTLAKDAPLSEIARGAFANCQNLTEISLPDAVKAIREVAFSGCYALANISVPQTLDAKEIPLNAFQSCRALLDQDGCLILNGTVVYADVPSGTETYSFRDGIVSINSGVLNSMANGGFDSVLHAVYVPDSVTYLGSFGGMLSKEFRFLFAAAKPEDGNVPTGWAADALPTGEFAKIEWGAAKPSPAEIAPAA